MVRTDARTAAMRPTLATSRGFFAAAVAIVVVGYAIILKQRWELTRLDHFAAIVAVGALAYTYRLKRSEQLSEEAAGKRDELLWQFAVFVLFLAFYSITAGSDTNPFNAHVRQAVAFIHGHTYIEATNYIEHAQMGPYSYQLHPPLPAILLMPFAAIWGLKPNQSYFSSVVGALYLMRSWLLL